MAARDIYIDETSGQDVDSVDGTEASPFKSLQFAYLKELPGARYLIKRLADDKTDQDPAAPSGFKTATKSALKKAQNTLDSQKKKAGKALDVERKKREDDAAREKMFEAAKQIKITEDSSLPAALKIKLDEQDPKLVCPLSRISDRSLTASRSPPANLTRPGAELV